MPCLRTKQPAGQWAAWPESRSTQAPGVRVLCPGRPLALSQGAVGYSSVTRRPWEQKA